MKWEKKSLRKEREENKNPKRLDEEEGSSEIDLDQEQT